VLLTTQYLDEADRLASRLVVVDRGQIIAEGTPAELKSKLGDTVLELGFPDEDTARRVESMLSAVTDRSPEREGALIRLSSSQGAKVLVDVLRRLDADGLAPATLAVREPSLDDVFLSITGKHAEEAPAEDPKTLARAGGRR
jgi:ABC-type multidrug transport system ATPase subunit